MDTISIEFGALAETIGTQLEKQGVLIKEEDAERFERMAMVIVLLHLQDIIPDSVRDNAQKKLMKKICSTFH